MITETVDVTSLLDEVVIMDRTDAAGRRTALIWDDVSESFDMIYNDVWAWTVESGTDEMDRPTFEATIPGLPDPIIGVVDVTPAGDTQVQFIGHDDLWHVWTVDASGAVTEAAACVCVGYAPGICSLSACQQNDLCVGGGGAKCDFVAE